MKDKILSVSLNPAVDISCTAEAVEPTIKVRTSNQVEDPGGCGVNVARVIATLGGRPELLYLAGGATGALLREILGSLPVKQHRVVSSASTRISYTVRDLKQGLEYRFIPEGPAIKRNEFQQVLDIVEQMDFDYIVTTGSLPKHAPQDAYAQIAQIAARKGARVILDSSGRALSETLEQASVFLIKPSLEEMEQLIGKPLDPEQAGEEALKIVRRGSAENIVVSMGAQGALLAMTSGVSFGSAPSVTPGSAVGAGDSFVAAMTFALANDIEIEEAFHLGIAAGSAAVMTTGTQLCRREDVVRLYKQEGASRDQKAINKLITILDSSNLD